MTPSEVRAAADYFDGREHETLHRSESTKHLRTLVAHVRETVPADGDDAITVELLERWGGKWVYGRLTFFRERDEPILCVPLQIGWQVSVRYSHNSCVIACRGITSAADLRQLLKLLGCKLEVG